MGVYRKVSFDRRRGRDYAKYQALWHDTVKSRVKHFGMGIADEVTDLTEVRARHAASSFRNAYYQARLADKPFDPSPWNNWKSSFPGELTAREYAAQARELARERQERNESEPPVYDDLWR